MSITYLKVKIKSLAEEAKIIRKEEQKALRRASYFRHKQNEEAVKKFFILYQHLEGHRHHPVGTEARAALIAYGYLRGLKYSQIEKPKVAMGFKKWTSPNGSVEYWELLPKRVYTLICKYGPDKKLPFETFEKWVEEN